MAELNLKEKMGQGWTAFKGFLVKRWPWVVAALVLALLALILAGYWVPWTGFRGKTLWDWLDLLLVPLLLALGAWLLTRAARDRELEIESDRSRQAALQTYLDRVSALLRERWRESGEGFLEANIIRAQTLTVLRQLDGERKALPLQFLYESGLIGMLEQRERKKALVNLAGANLAGANLRLANLAGANLTEVNLTGANLAMVRLRGANLTKADLTRAKPWRADLRRADLRIAELIEADLRWAYLLKANLSYADLRWANLTGAHLEGADLGRADLRWANLTGAHLEGADLGRADLRWANLEGADLQWANLTGARVTDEQLAQAKTLEGAILLDGTVYTSRAEPEPTPADTETDNIEGRPDQPDDLEAGEGVEGPTSA